MDEASGNTAAVGRGSDSSDVGEGREVEPDRFPITLTPAFVMAQFDRAIVLSIALTPMPGQAGS
jgi:hypothetical protein